MIFFEIKLLQQPDVFFDSESNGRNFSSLALFIGFYLSPKIWEKRLLVTSFCKKKLKIFFFSPPGGARELKLQSFDSESKTTSDCSDRLFSKKITPNSYFSLYQYLKRPLLQRFFICFKSVPAYDFQNLTQQCHLYDLHEHEKRILCYADFLDDVFAKI